MDKILIHDLEIDLWESCNLRCAQCTHAAPHFTDEDERYLYTNLEHDLTILKKFAIISNMRIVGGEPLLNKNLPSFLKMMREMNMHQQMVMFTNGLLLGKVDDDIFSYLDRLRISVYPSLSDSALKKIDEEVKKIREKFPNLNVVANEIPHFGQFNTLDRQKDETITKTIYDNCYYAHLNEGLAVFNGRLYRCYAARKKYKYLKAHESLVKDSFEHLKVNTQDSIELTDTLTREELETFLNRKDPLEACRWCLGCVGRTEQPHRQLKKGEQDIGMQSDLDVEGGKSYLSNCLLSWTLQEGGDPNVLKDNKFFSSKYIKDYSKRFTSKYTKK